MKMVEARFIVYAVVWALPLGVCHESPSELILIRGPEVWGSLQRECGIAASFVGGWA